MALGTPVAAAAAYSAASGTTVAPAYPAGILATDEVVLFVGQKPTAANGGTVTTPTGWTLRDSLTGAGGYGTTVGADVGNTNLFVYTWDTPVAGQTGNLTVTIGGNNVTWAFLVRVPTGGGAVSVGSADGQRTTTPTSPMTVALTNGATATNFQAGDLALWAMCIPTDVTTPAQFSAHSVTATGATFATAVEINEPDSTTGNDIGGFSAYARVSSGSSTAAPSITVTVGGTLTNVRGPVVLLRVREGAAAQTLTPALFTNTNTFHNPTVTRGTVTLTPALYTNDQTFYSADVTQGGGTQALTASLYTNDQTFYGPTVTRSNTLTPSLYTNAQTFYAATVSTSNTLAPALYTNPQTFYAPVVSQTGGAQTLLPDLYTNTQTFYASSVTATVTLQPARYDNQQAFYDPTVTTSVTLAPGLVTNSQTFYAPTVTQGSTTQELTFEDYVEVDYVEPGYVTWVAGFQAGNQFFSPTLQQFLQRGENYIPQLKRKRKWSEEREEQAQLRRVIEAAIDPVKAAAPESVQLVTSAKKGVALLPSTGPAVAVPAFPTVDAAKVARLVQSALQEAGIAARRVREAQLEQQSREALKQARENLRRLIRKRQQEEFLLLMT